MTVWRYVPAKKEQAAYFYPLAHFADRQMWRDIGVFYNTSETSKRPGVVEWICTLQEKESSLRMISFSLYESATDTISA